MSYADFLLSTLKHYTKTHEQFAQDLGVSVSTVSRWIRGHHTPHKLTREAIAQLFAKYESDFQLQQAS